MSADTLWENKLNTTEPRPEPWPDLAHRCCWLIALALGLVEAWTTRFTMFPDGISYLDMGDAFWRGDWHNAINAYWSPIYPLLLGSLSRLFKPSPGWEFPLVHLVNFLTYVVALISFDFFLRTFLKTQLEREPDSVKAQHRFPTWIWLIFGYCAFTISSLFLITISFPSPDMLVAAVIFLASALLLKIKGGKSSWRMFALLGVVLGFGYLTKTVMFLMSVPFIAVAATTQKTWGERIRFATVSFAFFAILAAPLVIALSLAKGRLTFGDTGKINYEINVGTTQFFIPNEGSATHPVRKLNAIPEAFEYGSPVSGTYPLWYDPTYWHEGIRLRFNLSRQIRTVLLTMAQCFWISFNVNLGLSITVVICILYLLSENIRASIGRAVHWWVLWVPGLAGIGLYSLVVIEPRHVAGQFCLLWIVAFSGVLHGSRISIKLISRAVCAMALLTGTVVVYQLWGARNEQRLTEKGIATPECEKVATALVREGLKPGDNIALISEWLFPSRQGAYIARLDRLRIIAEARTETFWAADSDARTRLMSEFAAHGARAVLTYGPPRAEEKWQRIDETDFYIVMLEHSDSR